MHTTDSGFVSESRTAQKNKETETKAYTVVLHLWEPCHETHSKSITPQEQMLSIKRECNHQMQQKPNGSSDPRQQECDPQSQLC
jgi:hypothetical protein